MVPFASPAGVFAGEATKHGFGGAFHPKCGSMRFFVFASLADGSGDAWSVRAERL
jgi:hypothetical protein